MFQTVLVAGATGMLGSRIAHYLLAEPEAKVRLLIRPRTLEDPVKTALLSPLLARGAEIIQGDLADRASLHRATMGVNVILSAVQGGPDIIHDGQLALLDAAKRNGVRRILPSDFALDLFETPDGEHSPYDVRRAADTVIAASGLEHVHIPQRCLHGRVSQSEVDVRPAARNGSPLGGRPRAVRRHER